MSDSSPHTQEPDANPMLEQVFEEWWRENGDRYQPHLMKDLFFILKSGWELRERHGFAERMAAAQAKIQRRADLKDFIVAALTSGAGYNAARYAQRSLEELTLLEARCDAKDQD